MNEAALCKPDYERMTTKRAKILEAHKKLEKALREAYEEDVFASFTIEQREFLFAIYGALSFRINELERNYKSLLKKMEENDG